MPHLEPDLEPGGVPSLKARPVAAAVPEYFYTCDPVGDAPPCGFWKPAPWAARTAARYLDEERAQPIGDGASPSGELASGPLVSG